MSMTVTTGIPDALVPWLKPEAVNHLRCSQISENEFLVQIATDANENIPGPVAMLGYARQFHNGPAPSTDDVLKELRAGER